jgi:hypothetical protein
MLKTDYQGYQLDTMEWNNARGYSVYYINQKTKHLVEGKGARPESACADAQKKIQKRVNDTA